MKFVYDPEQGKMVPEKYILSNFTKQPPSSDWEKDLLSWFTKDIAEQYSYSTRSIAYKFKSTFPQYNDIDTNTIRNTIAKRNNELLASNEDMGAGPAAPAGGIGASLTGSGSVDAISNPTYRKNIIKGSKESKTMISPQKNKNMPIIGTDGILGTATESEEQISLEGKGTCFQDSFRNFFKHITEKPLLVHGLITGQGPIEGLKYCHAWIEIGDTVIDTTIPLFRDGFPKEAYYSLARLDETLLFKYDNEQVMKKTLEYKTYGPWEDSLSRAQEDSKKTFNKTK